MADKASPIPQARSGLEGYLSLAPEVEAAILGGEQQASAARGRQAEATLAAGKAAAEAKVLEAEQAAGTNQLHQELLRAIGLDVQDPNSALNKEIRAAASSRTQREELDTEIAELESVSFFQNPFAFIANQPRIQEATAKYNLNARRENRANEEITRMQSLTESVMRLTPAKNADILRKQGQLQADVIVQTAQAKADELSAANAAGNAKAMLDAFALRQNVFASYLQVERLEEDIKDRRQRQADSNFWRGIKTAQLAEEKAAKEADKKTETALVTGINLYRKTINGTSLPDLTPEDVKRMPAQLKGAWYEVILRGNYGNEYSESIPFIQNFGNSVAASQQGNATMMQLVRNIKTRAEALAPQIMNREKQRNPLATIKPDQALQMAYNELFSADAGVGAKGSNKDAITASSPYALDFDAAAAVAKSAGGTGVVSTALLAAKERTPMASLNATYTTRMLVEDVQAQVVAGKASPKQAAEDLSRFIALQSATAYETNGLKYLNLPIATDWVITPGGAGKAQVDLMNPTKLENYLTSQVANSRRINSRVGTQNPVFGFR